MDEFQAVVSLSVAAPFVIAVQSGFSEWKFVLPILVTSILAYFAVLKLIPVLKHSTLEAGLGGRDLNKTSKKQM